MSFDFDSASYLSRMTGTEWRNTDSGLEATVTNKQAEKIQKIIDREHLQVTSSGNVISISKEKIAEFKAQKCNEAGVTSKQIASIPWDVKSLSSDATKEAVNNVRKIIDDPDETMPNFTFHDLRNLERNLRKISQRGHSRFNPILYANRLFRRKTSMDVVVHAALKKVEKAKNLREEDLIRLKTELAIATIEGVFTQYKKVESRCRELGKPGLAIDFLQEFTGRPPLHWAAARGYKDFVQTLIDAKADPNQIDFYGRTPLISAVESGNIEITRALIQAGADLNKTGFSDDATPLIVAASHGYKEVVQTLIDAKADPNQTNFYGRTPLMGAVESGNIEITRALIQAGADLNKADNKGMTPLMVAARYRHKEVVQTLINAGADLNKTNSDGKTPLRLAVESGNIEITWALIQAGANPNKADNEGMTPLDLARIIGDTKMVEALNRLGANKTGKTPHGVAAEMGNMPKTVHPNIRKAQGEFLKTIGVKSDVSFAETLRLRKQWLLHHHTDRRSQLSTSLKNVNDAWDKFVKAVQEYYKNQNVDNALLQELDATARQV